MLIESVDFSLAALLPALILGASAYLLPVLYRRFAKSLLQKLHALMPEVLQILSEAYLEPTTLLLRTFLGYAALHALPVQFAEKFPVYSVLALFFRLCVIFFIGYGAWRAAPMCHLLLRSAENHLDLATNKTMGRFFENIYKVLVVVFAGIAALDQLGVPVSGLLTGAGVAGLAISLAAQSTLSSLIAGITLVLEHPFGIGDYIILSSVEGTVEDISFRSTRIRNADNVVITIENSKVCAEYIQNANQRTSRLWQFTLGLTYDTTEEQIQRVTQDLTQLLQDQPTVQPNGVTVTLDKFNDYSLDILVRVYLTTLPYADYLKERHRLNLLIMQTVKNAGCEFAFPTITVEMAKDK